MKTIAIVRHAKSSWSDFSLKDVKRPLNNRGKRDAPLMAKHLFDTGFNPGIFIASHSKRTQLTAKHFLKAYNKTGADLILDQQLYLGAEHDFIDTMFSFDENHETAIMFGHNPGLTDIANLCSSSFIENVPTSGILLIEMDIYKWIDADWNKAKLKAFYYPKML